MNDDSQDINQEQPAPTGPKKEHSTFVSFALYVLVAPASLVADLSVFNLLHSVFSWGVVPSHLISRPIGGLVCFYLNKHVTFQNKGKSSTKKELIKFWVVFGVSYLLSTGLLTFFDQVLNLGANPAKLLAEAICVLFNYISLRFWTFR